MNLAITNTRAPWRLNRACVLRTQLSGSSEIRADPRQQPAAGATTERVPDEIGRRDADRKRRDRPHELDLVARRERPGGHEKRHDGNEQHDLVDECGQEKEQVPMLRNGVEHVPYERKPRGRAR